MKSDEKDEALKHFRCGETHILLSTQVIVVSVDVLNASLMVVMNAERFVIAQLHQLRGRVGHGARKSKCIFVTSTATSLNRLKSGHLPEFPIARLEVDGNILQQARLAALKILSASHELEKFLLLKPELSMKRPLSFLGD
ncbi:ATP-dependent DNA helicase recG [Morus notabilis]|uniref:ATP-dependent DNA helicase recG n=1 Tax=Morus notabilis TaxID=981085 RepID=W9RPA8_9ROSA|nr:ATP-dependent DNA helicase recG [Morus notabilis]